MIAVIYLYTLVVIYMTMFIQVVETHYIYFIFVYDFTNNITYNNRVSLTRELNINLVITPGDILTFKITPNNSGTPSTQTSHNIQLYLATSNA